MLFKSGYEGSLEEYVGDCKWNPVEYKELKNNLVEISEKQADNKIKEIEGDEYDLVDGYVLCDFSGEV
mgnify:FL=1